jgi:hypothetical protein
MPGFLSWTWLPGTRRFAMRLAVRFCRFLLIFCTVENSKCILGNNFRPVQQNIWGVGCIQNFQQVFTENKALSEGEC